MSIRFGDAFACLRDVHSELKFVVYSMNGGRRQMYLLGQVADCTPRLEEDHWCFGDLNIAHLFPMVEIVEADADDLGERFQRVSLV